MGGVKIESIGTQNILFTIGAVHLFTKKQFWKYSIPYLTLPPSLKVLFFCDEKIQIFGEK